MTPAPITITPHEAFRDFCANLGFDIGGLPEEGRIVRFPVEGDKGHAKNGYYQFHADHPANGRVGNWKGDGPFKWKADRRYTQEPRQDFAKRRQEREERRREEYAQAAREARHRWLDGGKPHDHPYLKRKGIQAHGVRLWRGTLIVPAWSADGKITSAQYIWPDGSKRYHPKGFIVGSVYVIGPKPAANSRLLICEGFATGATLHEATGNTVFVAFDAGNMVASARWLCERFASNKWLVCGDDDWSLPLRPKPLPNAGRVKAEEAARILKTRAAFPDRRGELWTDFNDQAQAFGLDDVRATLAEGRR